MNIRLREVEPADLPHFFAHQEDAVAVEMVAFTSRERAAFDGHWAKIRADATSLIRTVVARRRGRREHRWLEFARTARGRGYWIDRASWGRGVGTAALSAFLRLEQTRPLHPGVAKHNLA
ncbi:MAG: GNAT family N-acetyltransferase [Verrucomicrobiota bacterium]|nr:GNAT family N-acetyltransferase [Verrucomicrobiota bacterium]